MANLGVAQQWEEGEHYQKVPVPFEANPTGSPIVVTEVFSYACIHCYTFEKPLTSWIQKLNPDEVKFERQHVVFGAPERSLAAAFAIAERRGVVPNIHDRMFAAIHNHKLNMANPDLLVRLFRNQADVSEEDFLAEFESAEIEKEIRDNIAKSRVWRITATPTMVVDGRYTVTPSDVGSVRRVLEVVDFLVRQTLAERAENTATSDN